MTSATLPGTSTVLDGIAGLTARVGTDLGVSTWHPVEQQAVSTFADLTGDRQWIHTDPDRARTGPYGQTIQHGFLTLGLGTALLDEVVDVTGVGVVLNYGLDRVRFPAPLRVGSRVRMHVHLTSVTPVGTAAEVRYHLVYEVEDQPKPCCVADLVFRYYP